MKILAAILSAPFGLIAVAWTAVVRSYLALPFQWWMLRRAAGIAPQDALSPIIPPLLASLVMAAGVWGLMTLLRPYFSVFLVPIFICVGAGMAMYAIALYAISSDARILVHYGLKALRAKKRG